MKKFLIALFSVTSLACLASQAQEVIKVTDPVERINPLMGTDSNLNCPMVILTLLLLYRGE